MLSAYGEVPSAIFASVVSHDVAGADVFDHVLGCFVAVGAFDFLTVSIAPYIILYITANDIVEFIAV